MDEKGYFFLTEVDGDIDDFIIKHQEELRLCAESGRANSVTIAGVYVEYRPAAGEFSHVVSASRVGW